MKIAEDTMKVIGVFLIAGLAGCSDDCSPSLAPDAGPGPVPDAAPGPVPDAAPFCSLDTPLTCQAWWPQETQESAAPKSISYNALAADALMFNALLRNPRANKLMANHAGGLKGLLWGTDDGAKYVQTQLQDPFARRTMGYLIGCALPPYSQGGPMITWSDHVSKNTVIWEGDLGLCPSWLDAPMSSECQELLSACLLARNNALDREVLISVRGVREELYPDRHIAPLPYLEPTQGGEPCESEIGSFERPCDPPMTTPMDPTSNCKGWKSHYIGSCQVNDTVTVKVTMNAGPASTPLFRICHGVSGCDYVDPLDPDDFPHIESRACSPGSACEISFDCSDRQAFTLMYANVKPGDSAMPGDFTVSVTRTTMAGMREDIPYPGTEEKIYPWQEGAFYGNLFCGENEFCDPMNSQAPVDFSLWVEVCGDVNNYCGDDYASGTVVYHRPLLSDPPPLPDAVYGPAMGTERDLLKRRGSGHQDFLVASRYIPAKEAVYQRMYSCMSPNWVPDEAMAKERLCAGLPRNYPGLPNGVTYCAAHSEGRCWGDVFGCSDGSIMVTDTPAQCEVKDTFPHGDMDYGQCRAGRGRLWQYPLTVFLNDPCDIVPEDVYLDSDEVACKVPLCRQTTRPAPLPQQLPPEQPPDSQQLPP